MEGVFDGPGESLTLKLKSWPRMSVPVAALEAAERPPQLPLKALGLRRSYRLPDSSLDNLYPENEKFHVRD